MSWTFEHGKVRHELALLARRPELRIKAGGTTIACSERPASDGMFSLEIGGRTVTGWRHVAGNEVHVRLDGRTYSFRRVGPESGDAQGGGSHADVRAEMPGTVVAVHTALGSDVEEGAPLLTIESMKLQLSIVAHRAGRIAAVHVTENATFDRGALLVSFAADPAAGKGA